ncbi:MAG: hypothetical protein CFE46_04955 [Burkholderiales bacterium PBB6]|nr:MAG: hypothetical protein CFE46_04955 [Burkholderiales bacterium PBB6]
MRSAARPKALVAAWFDFLSPAQRPMAIELQAAVRGAVPDVAESIRWGNLVFTVDDELMAALVPHKAHINLQFYQGASLPAHIAELDGNQRDSRSLKCRLSQPLDGVKVEMLVAAAAVIARRQALERAGERAIERVAERPIHPPNKPA